MSGELLVKLALKQKGSPINDSAGEELATVGIEAANTVELLIKNKKAVLNINWKTLFGIEFSLGYLLC